MKIKFKPFPEKSFKEIISEVGEYRYEMFSPQEKIPGSVFTQLKELKNCQYALVGTGATTGNYVFTEIKTQSIVIPKGSPVFVARFFRYDDQHGTPHYNAYDHIIFPTKRGEILSLSRNDAPDHYIQISELSLTHSIAEAYKLPEKKSGTVEEYKEKGATIHLEPEPVRSEDDGKS